MSQLEITERSLSDLVGFDGNPRTIDSGAKLRLKNSIRTLGLFKPLLVWENEFGEQVVIGGNQRMMAMREMLEAGEKLSPSVPCVKFEGSRKAAHIVALRDNHSDGDWDWRKLPAYISELQDLASGSEIDLALTGFSEDDLSDMLELASESKAGIEAEFAEAAEGAPADEPIALKGTDGPDPKVGVKSPMANEGKRARFARFVVGNVRGRISIELYGRWLELFETYSDQLGSTDVGAVFTAFLERLEVESNES